MQEWFLIRYRSEQKNYCLLYTSINNGANFDDYVRFAFDVTVTDPGRIVVANTISAGDYSAFSIEFADYQEVIESCLGLTLSEFITACKEPGGPIALYMVCLLYTSRCV